uniref:NET domain-containing protein n=1 Tax=viral metagenome TaxID=1070528 RepID=A0A6C0KE57_9ZZZZ
MVTLKKLKEEVEKFNEVHQLEILRILQTNNIEYSENRNGTFVNLTNLNSNIIKEIERYVHYVKDQKNILEEQESEKSKYIKNYFKENNSNISK